ncbi:MAG: hypothetical protein RL090_508 [Bacteroidota bacterium]
MRIKFRRMLIPAFTLVFSVVAGVWFYISYTDLDLFTVKNFESQAGPCSNMALKPIGDFQIKAMVFLSKDNDSNLVAAFHSSNDLLKSFQDETGCFSADRIRNAVLESKKCLKELIQVRMLILQAKSWHNHRMSSYTPNMRSTDSTLLFLGSTLIKEFVESNRKPGPDSLRTDTTASIARMNLVSQSPDTLKSQLINLLAELNGSYLAFMTQREQESTRLAEARLQHGLRMGEARSRLFQFTLIAWMISLLLISTFYIVSVFKRNRPGIEAGLMSPATVVRPVVRDQLPSNLPLRNDEVSSDVEVASGDVDLSKVFFKCGGDIHLMKQMLNRYLTSTFAIAHNLKSYSKNGSIDSADRMLRTLLESTAEMGFESTWSQAKQLLELMESNPGKDEIAIRIAGLSDELFIHISKIKDQMGRHPAFK